MWLVPYPPRNAEAKTRRTCILSNPDRHVRHRACRGDDSRQVLRPTCRQKMLSVPLAFLEHQQSEPGEIASGEVHGIFTMNPRGALLLSGPIEILHGDWPREIRFERIIDVPAGQFLERRAGRVKVPILIAEERAGILRSVPRR